MRDLTLNHEDLQRGWVPCKCGKHAYVFRLAPAVKIPLDIFEWCPAVECHLPRLEAVEQTLEGFERGKRKGL